MNDQNKGTDPGANPTPSSPMDPIRAPAPGPVTPPANSTPTPPPANPAPTQPAAPTAPVPTMTNEQLAEMLTADNTEAVDTAPPEPSVLQKAGSGFMTLLGGLFSWIIFPLAVVLILHFFVFQAYHVLGTSMNQTLQQSDYLIISKVGYTEALIGRLFHKDDVYLPGRGQIIVFHYPKDPSEIFVKRVIGVPGDHIVIKNGTVTLYTKDKPDGYNPDTGYEPAGTTTSIDTDEIVRPGNVFVMGDNRAPGGSYDSREWGQLPSSYIIGNAVLRLLPLDAVKIL